MEALFAALAQYIDYLVLGAVAFPVLCLPFGLMKPLRTAWARLSFRVRRSHTFIQAGLITGVLFSAFYFSGYLLNAVGHTFLRRAHYSVINSAATFDTKQKPPFDFLGMRADFLVRSFPIVGPFLWPPRESELKSYWDDAARQFYWDVCDPHSLDDMTEGGIIKELRLLRGLAGLTQILLAVCVVAWWLSRRGQAYVPNQALWSKRTIVGAIILYEALIVPAYWDAEYEEHSTIWAAFPQGLDPLTTAQMDQYLPCKKMKMMTAGKKNDAKSGEEASSTTSPNDQ
jgi:hypothetical protein